jgi:hypothetical protein
VGKNLGNRGDRSSIRAATNDLAKLTQIVSLLAVAACGQVSGDDDPSPEPPGTSHSEAGDLDFGIDPAVPPAAESPFIIDAPRAATTSTSLFKTTVRDHASVMALIGTGSQPLIDVIEQRIVTKKADPVAISIDIAPPAGDFARVISSDVFRAQYATLERTLCSTGNIATFDPKCETATPTRSSRPGNGALAAPRWRVWVMNEETGVEVSGCSAIGTHLECTLPGRAVVPYRIMASVDSLSELWGASGAPGVHTLEGATFTGARSTEYQCVDWETSGVSDYCRLHWVWTRYTAIDRAGIELEPLRVTISAGDVTSSHDSPALTWDSGDADLPGANY